MPQIAHSASSLLIKKQKVIWRMTFELKWRQDLNLRPPLADKSPKTVRKGAGRARTG
jgi:hypothetical protein